MTQIHFFCLKYQYIWLKYHTIFLKYHCCCIKYQCICPKLLCICQIALYFCLIVLYLLPNTTIFFLKLTLYFSKNTTVFDLKYHFICPKYFLQIPLHLQKIPIFVQNTAVFFTIDLCMSNYLLWQHEARSQHTNVKLHCGGRASSPTHPQCHLGDCQVHLDLHAWLGVLGSVLVDIGLKLHSVHFAIKLDCKLHLVQLKPKSAQVHQVGRVKRSETRQTWARVGEVALSPQCDLT